MDVEHWNIPQKYNYAFLDKPIHEYALKYDFFEYKEKFYSDISTYCDLREKIVLEIGGSETPPEICFSEFKAKKWVSLDKPLPYALNQYKDHYDKHKIFMMNEWMDAIKKNDYVILNGFTDDITEEFYDAFDVVVSSCCFEHIFFLRSALEKIYMCLKKDGSLYSSFGPIYSSSAGTHFWVSEELNFSTENFPADIGHAHLLLSINEIYHLLQPYCAEASEDAAFKIKNSDPLNQHINYYFYEDYVEILRDSKFPVKCMRPSGVSDVPLEKMSKLQKMYPGRKRFDVNAIEVFCQK